MQRRLTSCWTVAKGQRFPAHKACGIATGQFVGGFTIGFNAGMNGVLAGALFGPVVGVTLVVNFLATFEGISNNSAYQGILGWSSWLMPMSWTATLNHVANNK